jgi:hypothetical protein
MENTMKDLSPFYIQAALDLMAKPVKNASRLRDGTVLVQTKTDKQNEQLLIQKLLGSYPVLAEKQNLLLNQGCIFCSQVDECDEEEIQAVLANQYVWKVYCVCKKEEKIRTNTNCIFNL